MVKNPNAKFGANRSRNGGGTHASIFRMAVIRLFGFVFPNLQYSQRSL